MGEIRDPRWTTRDMLSVDGVLKIAWSVVKELVGTRGEVEMVNIA